MLSDLFDGGPDGVSDALGVIADVDATLVHGVARLAEREAALTALAGAAAPSPLGKRVAVAVDGIIAGSVDDAHLAALAAARTAIMGAVHDALIARFDAATGRHRTTNDIIPGVPVEAHLVAAARAWLSELAITGWRGVDHDLVASAHQIIAALLTEASLRRLAVLLDGFAAELGACCPVATMETIPMRRWADLWARAVMLSQIGTWTPEAAEVVSGRLLLVGVDIHEHGSAVQAEVHAVLEAVGAAPRLVRTSVAAAKVDTIVGPAVWQLFSAYPMLMRALAERRGLEVTDVPLLGSGELRWHDDRALVGDVTDPFTTARVMLPTAVAAGANPLDRHPVRISEPILIERYSTATDHDGGVTFTLDGQAIPVDLDRLPRCGPLTRDLVAASSACIGLMRWDDDGWSLQPLALQATVKRKRVEAHNGDWAQGPTDPKMAKAAATGGDAVTVLRERAGRLLRKW